MTMTMLRKWWLLIAVLYLAPTALPFASAAAHPAMAGVGDGVALTAAGGEIALASADGNACEHCLDGGEQRCAGSNSDCCFLCSVGVAVVRVQAVAPFTLRDPVAVRKHGPLAQAEFPPPFRPPIG